MKPRLFVPIVLLTMACSQQEPIPGVGDVEPYVSLGETLANVRGQHPKMSLVPGVGWIEQLPDSRDFASVTYEFSWSPFGKAQRRVSAVTYVGKDPSRSPRLIAALDSLYGRHSFVGCIALPPRGAREEISVVRWENGAVDVFVHALMREGRERRALAAKPLVVSFVRRRDAARKLSLEDLQGECFSRTLFSRVHPSPTIP